MLFAIAFIGMIGIALGITLLPGGMPAKAPPPVAASTAPAQPASPDAAAKH
jgi:hypothetical protein